MNGYRDRLKTSQRRHRRHLRTRRRKTRRQLATLTILSAEYNLAWMSAELLPMRERMFSLEVAITGCRTVGITALTSAAINMSEVIASRRAEAEFLEGPAESSLAYKQQLRPSISITTIPSRTGSVRVRGWESA